MLDVKPPQYNIRDPNEDLRNRVHQLEQLVNDMYAQLGGDGDPRNDEDHPGHILTLLGWTFYPNEPGEEPDYLGCHWRDPEAPRGKLEILPMNLALSIALKRLYLSKTRIERIGQDESLVLDED